MAKSQKEIPFNPRPYMELAIAEMNKSKNEPRPDGKVPPKVGAILVFPDGRVVQAHRGELREGDHAEFTLLERKLGHEKLDDCILFTTLEPCAERNHPKVPCCRRTTNARIKTVYVGVEDPDPTVAGKGIKHLEAHKVEIRMFDRDLQKVIEDENDDFLNQALERKRLAEEEDYTTPIELPVSSSSFKQFSIDALQKFITQAKLDYSIDQPEFKEYLADLGALARDKSDGPLKPTGVGLLLFGSDPRNRFKGAVLKCTAHYGDDQTETIDFDQPLVLIPDLLESWIRKVLPQTKDTSKFRRQEISSFPMSVLREAVINALVHRDYSIEGAKSYLQIDLDKIVVKSPGGPLPSISLEQLNSFRAPSISRNPIISYVFNKMGYAEETGFGMYALRSLNEKYDLPLPEFVFEAPNLILSFARDLESAKKISSHPGVAELTDDQLKGYDWLKTVGEASTREYSNHLDIGYKTAQRHLSKMRELNLIGDNGADPNSPNFKHVIK